MPRRRVVEPNEGLDIGITPILKDLWTKGYETRSSCEGGESHYPTAYILLDRKRRLNSRQVAEIKSLIKKHTKIPFKIFGWGAIVFKGPLNEPYTIDSVSRGIWPWSGQYPEIVWRRVWDPVSSNWLIKGQESEDDYLLEEEGE